MNMMTFNVALKSYLNGLSVKSVTSNKVYSFNKGLKIEQSSKSEQFGFWMLAK